MTNPYRHIECRTEQGVLVLTITEPEIQGEDIATGLRAEMLAAAEEFKPRCVIVDFQKTDYISSVAFWPLLSLHRRLQSNGGRITVCGLNPIIGDVFYSTRLVSPSGAFPAPFGIDTDVRAALARLTAAGTGQPAV